MKNKPNDIPYLGCTNYPSSGLDPVLNMESLKKYYNYNTERQNIYIKKTLLGQPAPWTDDEILRSYKFTNVRRETDRASKWLIEHISENPKFDLDDKMFRSILFRIYNRPETAELIELDSEDFWDKLDLNIKRLESTTTPLFTDAYVTAGIKSSLRHHYPDKWDYRAHHLQYIHELRELWNHKIPDDFKKDGETCYKSLIKNVLGLSTFMSYQVFCDFTYIPEYPISENEYTVAGPGCKRGLDILFEDKNGLTYEDCLFWVRDHFEDMMKMINPEFSYKSMFSHLPEYDQKMSLQACENSFCEFSKYCRIMEGNDRKIRKYNGFVTAAVSKLEETVAH